MNKKKHIYLSSPHMSDEGYEQMFVKEAFDSNWIAPLGKNVDEFEVEMSNKVGAVDAAALSSGTAALHLALKSIGIRERDIVFCSTLTFSASANPILYEKAIPVFIDVDENTWNMSPEALEKAFIKFPSVKAVIIVHLYGMTADLEKIMSLCRKYNVPLIEDAAESLGSTYRGQYTGTIGDYGVYSFNGNKIITSSGGGMLVSTRNDAKIRMNKVRFWATQSRDKARHYEHSELGYNYRMSNIVAGIGRGQLKVLDERIAKKRYIYKYYSRELSTLLGITMMPTNNWNGPNYWLSCILLDGKLSPLDVILALEEDNIESRPIWKPMHLQPLFKEFEYIDNGGMAEYIFNHGVCLPSDTKMTDEDLERICSIIKQLWGK